MYWQPGFAALLAIGGARAGVVDLMAEGAVAGRSPKSLESRMSEIANEQSSTTHILLNRQNTLQLSSVNATLNMTAWNAEVTTACEAALSKLAEATNPSGTCTCYNLPALNTQTGAFEADLRLYQLSAARDEFAGIPQNQVQVALSYSGASVSPVSASTAQSKVTRRQTTGSNLKLLQTYLFVGQIDPTKLQASDGNMASLEAFVMPTVTLSAVTAGGQTVSTNVSSNEAAFVAGAFSTATVLSTTAQAQIAVDQVVAGLANGTVAFVLPGVNLLIFPVGLVVASVWFVVGLLVIGFGFFERVQYRETYRRRSAYAAKGETRRI